MKKTIYAFVTVCLLTTACGTKDNKNEVEHYPTYDTTSKMENINSGDPGNSTSGSQAPQGENH